MSPFKPGDRVRVYGGAYDPQKKEYVRLGRAPVSFVRNDGNGFEIVVAREGELYWAEPQQCRRLKPKKPKQRRRWTLIIDKSTGNVTASYHGNTCFTYTPSREECVRVREEKERP